MKLPEVPGLFAGSKGKSGDMPLIRHRERGEFKRTIHDATKREILRMHQKRPLGSSGCRKIKKSSLR